MVPVETKYARSGSVHIAYQVIGSGPLDLVFVPGWISHVEYNWDDPLSAHFLQRLASFSRLIVFDKRGTGLSDRANDLPTLEQRMDDVRAVMDAVGSERAAIMGTSEGGNMCVLFAATYPERTRALIVAGMYAKRIWSPDYPWAPTPEERQQFFDWIVQDWGGVVDLDVLAPSMVHNEPFRRWFAAYLRRSASPGAALALAQMNTQIDVCPVLPSIHVPTLVLHRIGDLDVNIEEARYIAAHIPDAQLVELPGSDHLWWTEDADRLLDEVEKFLINLRHLPEPVQILATVLVITKANRAAFQETERLVMQEALAQFRGRELTSDTQAFMATFDGPTRAIRCVTAIREQLHLRDGSICAGLHTGECEIRGSNLSGLALRLAEQAAETAVPDQILISNTVKDLIAGSNIALRALGNAALPEKLHLFEVVSQEQAKLTPRERAILALIAEGLTNQEIAAQLNLSEHTVHRHIANIFNKLSVSSRAAAVAYALLHKLL
ncbi:MAG: alpha/beta fold hydrolase [Anaerolineae bacterium]|nr:alpha/beta fold hydrolase [Anaerolineae bacterium]